MFLKTLTYRLFPTYQTILKFQKSPKYHYFPMFLRHQMYPNYHLFPLVLKYLMNLMNLMFQQPQKSHSTQTYHQFHLYLMIQKYQKLHSYLMIQKYH